MDVKDLRTEPALRDRNNDVSKYTQGGVATLQSNRNKPYQDIGSNPLAKTEGVPVRPCAVIGPDRVVPPPATSDTFLKKGSVEPWPNSDNGYRRPPDYPHRLHQSPVRNISPRQTFQENMQRINVPPTYNAVRHSDSVNFNHIQDRSVTLSKNAKPNMALEAKYCDVPYAINALANEPKNIRDSVCSVNSQLTRNAPNVWPPGSVTVNAPRTYSVNEPYQYPQYTNCVGQRPPVIPVPRPQRPFQEDPAYVYPDHYYRDAIGRLKPYPPVKERCTQPRYEYVGNYGGQFHSPSIQPLKYDIAKSGQTQPYPVYPHFKYLDNRVPDSTLDAYQRSTSHHPHYNLPFRTQVIHPPYNQGPGTIPQKIQPFSPDASVKGIPSNKLHYDTSSKMYIDLENSRTKPYPMTDNYYVNEMNRIHSLKNQMVMPNYSPLGMCAMSSQQYYLKDNTQMKPFEYMPTFRNFEPHLPGNPVLRHAPQFSPNTLAISPTDSSISNDTPHIHGTPQEDCGYVSQSSTTSARSIDSTVHRLPHEYYKRHDFRYAPNVGSSQLSAKTDSNSKDTKQKQIDVRQFLQMWNEGEEENNCDSNNSKEIVVQTGSSDKSHFTKHANTEDQLYVLGLVNVSNEDLSKYEHIEKISKLPENIKGYNNLELFSRFEEAMESCNTTTFKTVPKDYQQPLKDNMTKIVCEALPRPVSPLDVEAKISQSVIHKEVGCNFEIKPCSPKMLNVEIAAPVQNILGERMIEKVSNPLSKIVKSPVNADENPNCHSVIRQDNVFALTDNPSCKMIHSPYSSSNMDSVKTNYTLQDLEINSGVCLASLPRLDNEIELNFPEVNQQFINANKKDGFSSATDSPQTNLQEETSMSGNKVDKLDAEKSNILPTEPDKTFNKLSKYRKTKTSVPDSSENKKKAVRTDSVIIKNPENIENKMLENTIITPMNLSSQSSQLCSSQAELTNSKNSDIALDFSLNKSGSNNPVIETENETQGKQFQTNDFHIAHENILPTDINASCQESISDNTMDPKTAIESIAIVSNDDSCALSCPDLSTESVLPAEDVSYEKSGYVNDTEQSKDSFSEFIQTDSELFEVHSTDKHFEKKSNICSETTQNKNIENTDQFVSPQINKSKQPIDTTQNENDFEHDEISASLEKLFQDHNEEISVTKINSYSSSELNSKSIETNKISSRQSKELYSPWIQKLLTHSEGSCSYNEPPEKQIVKSIFDPDEPFDKHVQPEVKISKDSLEEKMEIKYKDREPSPLNTKTDNCINENVTNDKTIDSRIAYESITINHIPDNDKDSMKVINEVFNKKENLPELTTKILTEQHDIAVRKLSKEQVSHEIINENKRNYECIADTSKRKTKNHELLTEKNTIKSLDTENEYLNYTKKDSCFCKNNTKTDIETHMCVLRSQNKLIEVSSKNVADLVPYNTEKSSESTFESGTVNSDSRSRLDAVVQDDLSETITKTVNNSGLKLDVLSQENSYEATADSASYLDLKLDALGQRESNDTINENVSDSVAKFVAVDQDKWNEDKTDNVSYSELRLDALIQGPNETNTKTMSNSGMNLDEVVEDSSHKIITENVSCDISYCSSFPGHKMNEKLRKDVIDCVFLDSKKDIPEISISHDICVNYSISLEKHSHESLSKLVKHQDNKSIAQSMSSNVNINKVGVIDDKTENSEGSNIVFDNDHVPEGISECVVPICTYIGNEEAKRLKYTTDHHEKETNTSFSVSSNISPKVFKDINVFNGLKHSSTNLTTSDCTSYQVEQSVQEVVEKRTYANTEEILDEPNHSDSDNGHIVSQKIHKKCFENNNSQVGVELQLKTNQSILIENVIETCGRDLHAENSNTSEGICIDKNINQESVKICSEGDSDVTKNSFRKKNDEKTLQDMKKHDTYEALDTASTTIKKDEIFPKDQHTKPSNIIKGFSVAENSYELKQQCDDNVTENIGESFSKEKSNLNSFKTAVKNVKVKNTHQESRYDRDNLSKNAFPTEKDICQDNVYTNNIDTKDKEVYDSIKKVHESFENSNFGGNLINIRDEFIKLETQEKIYTRNKTNLKDTNHQIPISLEDCDSNNIFTESYRPIQEHKCDNALTNLSDSVSEKWIRDYNEQTTLFSTVNTNSSSEHNMCCEDNENCLCNPVGENNLVELENNLSEHIPESSVEESLVKHRLSLKRSFSDSALNKLKNGETPDRQMIDNTPMWPPKRQRMYEYNNSEQHTIDENFCNFIHNRRNSISSYYNAENVSFCILIDNDCILAEENEGEKICFAEVSEDCITEVNTASVDDNLGEVMYSPDENQLDFSDSVMLDYNGEKSVQEAWLDDVACIETVVSDDIVEELDEEPPSFSRDLEVSNYDESGFFHSEISEHETNLGSEEVVRENVSEFGSTYKSVHGDDNIMLYDEDPQYADRYDALYSGQCLEKILSKSYRKRCSPSPTSDYTESTLVTEDTTDPKLPENKENICVKNLSLHNFESKCDYNRDEKCRKENYKRTKRNASIEPQQRDIIKDIVQNDTCSPKPNNIEHLPESTVDKKNNFTKDDNDVSDTTSSSSPEVSSTTFEEKCSSILLKITNYNGSRVSEINEVNRNKPRCKFTESKDYSNSQGNFSPKKPLLTKAAQKYIPPIKESIRDLKVKLPLPEQRLLKLKQLKLSRSEPKIVKQNTLIIAKKQKLKPNFEDVLKNIDEAQIKMHKQNNKKNKNIVPKVVIKKNVNGSHYTSSSSKQKFNPDLTGRKWQPWVFLERNRFIDNMAMRNKTKAIFSHRKNSYVSYEEFKKYKSVSSSSAKFVITQPNSANSSKGHLKYTIKLKHS